MIRKGSGAMSRRYKKAVDRQQGLLLPERVDDYVSADNPVRVIDVFVDALDLEALEFTNTKGQSAGGGQPSYDPASLLKLYLYGYVNRVHSSRRLEREAHRNLEVIWLTGQQRPSYKTIADFRKNNGPSLKAVHKGFLLTCKELGLLGGEVVGIDGSFFQGDASKKSIHTEKHLNKQLRELDRKIEAYQQQLAQQDRRDEQSGQGSLVQTPGLEEKLEQLRQKQAEKKSLVEQLKASGQPQISLTDPDARLLSKRGHSLAGYHVQLAVDAKHKLIAVSQLTQEGNDAHQLSGMAIEAKEFLGVEQLTVVADSGYYEGEQIKTCEDQKRGIWAATPGKPLCMSPSLTATGAPKAKGYGR
jgi:transposase